MRNPPTHLFLRLSLAALLLAAVVPSETLSAMVVELIEKRFEDRGSRHRGECYGAVLNPDTTRPALAWLRVEGTRESLVYRPAPGAPEVVLASATYVLGPHFAGDWLFWIQRIDQGDWRIRGIDLAKAQPGSIHEPFALAGRPLGLTSGRAGGTTWLAWEEREGKRTRLLVARFGEGEFGAPVAVTDGTFNAYDPVCAVAPDGSLYLAYCAFLEGNYRIMLQRLDARGWPQGVPQRISNQEGACVHPSICSRREGGVWVSFTALDVPTGPTSTFLQTPEGREQHAFFLNNSRLCAIAFDGTRTWAPFAPPDPGQHQGFVAAGLVFGSDHASRSRVFEDRHGRLHILFRQHMPAGTESPSFADFDPPLRRAARVSSPGSPRYFASGPQHQYAGYSLVTLLDDRWSAVTPLLGTGFIDEPLSLALRDDGLHFAFSENSRWTGWDLAGEWFDGHGELGVGWAILGLPPMGPPRYDFRPFVLLPGLGSSMEIPQLPGNCEGGYIHAIGQTHKHSTLSVCLREMDRDGHTNYRFMQDAQHSDFGALTDHDYGMWQTEMLLTHKLADYYYFPGEFVAFPAYEWTGSLRAASYEGGPWGHVNPLYLEEEGDLVIHCAADRDSPGGSLGRLWQAYADKRIVTPPHHPADNTHPYNWDFHDSRFVSVVEIFQSLRGSGEQSRGPGVTNFLHREHGHWALDALKRGRRFGFIAGGDHSGVARAGVLVRELTRAGLYEGLIARRCFATTGHGARLIFSCNGVMMGGEVTAEVGRFHLSIAASTRIRELQITRNGSDWRTVTSGKQRLTHRWSARREDSGEFWYCRVLFEDGNIVWSSPLWLL